jgi:bacteriophage N4 adsorption protein B
MHTLDSVVAGLLIPLAALMLVSGLDDFVLVLAMAWQWIGRRRFPPGPSEAELRLVPEQRIAVFVPLWREDRVIRRMLEHNLAAIRYRQYDFFVGAYPNDEPTLDAVRDAERRYPNVHLAVCPHDGPTSKADCLNWIYQRMLLFEDHRGLHFDIIVTHDAEDLVHPDSLRWINFHSRSCDMVQVPVLPLATPLRSLTHGVYCDEFAEYQTKDVPLRTVLGGFLPSNGVGTGYTRCAIEKLAETSSNRVFEPDCLTEDYENGLRLHRLGFRQMFVPLRFTREQPMATREYFPQSFRQAVRQRTRWVIGIALQSWERHGWRGGPAVAYWFWRDRKSLLGHPVSIAGNAVFLCGLTSWLWSRMTGLTWELGHAIDQPLFTRLLVATTSLQTLHMLIRAACSGRIYGWRFALGVPIRAVWANWINSVATTLAVYRYARARLEHRPLVWLKTEHMYPSREALRQHRPPEPAVWTPCPVDIGSIRREVARSLPLRIIKKWRSLPLRVADGCLFVASPDPPGHDVEAALRSFTRLEIRFQLVSEDDFNRLGDEFLSPQGRRQEALRSGSSR